MIWVFPSSWWVSPHFTHPKCWSFLLGFSLWLLGKPSILGTPHLSTLRFNFFIKRCHSTRRPRRGGTIVERSGLVTYTVFFCFPKILVFRFSWFLEFGCFDVFLVCLVIDTYNVSVDFVLWGYCKSKLQGCAQSAYEIRCTNMGIQFQGLHPIQQLCRIQLISMQICQHTCHSLCLQSFSCSAHLCFGPESFSRSSADWVLSESWLTILPSSQDLQPPISAPPRPPGEVRELTLFDPCFIKGPCYKGVIWFPAGYPGQRDHFDLLYQLVWNTNTVLVVFWNRFNMYCICGGTKHVLLF